MGKELDIQNLIREAIDKNLPTLDLHSISEFSESDQEDLTEIPDILFELINIEELDLSYHFSLSKIPDMLQRLKNLKKLTIKGNFDEFPLELMGMKSLEHLVIESDSLSILPKELDNWNLLNYLNISGCSNMSKIVGLPPNLAYIYVVGTNFKAYPDKIFELQKVRKIVTRNFRLKELPNGLFKLKSLMSLFVGDNLLSGLPKDILHLTNLHELWLDNNLFEKFPEVLLQMDKLERLNLRSNLLEDIPDSISHLVNLTELSLGKNKLKAIPSSIFKLKKIEDLQFGNFNFGDKDVKENNNEIRNIPNEILDLEKLVHLELDSNYIENVPAEIVKDGVDAIKNFLRSLKEADQEEHLYEAKMVVVGRGDVGKTVLTKKLTFPKYSLSKSKTTKGINILKNPFEFSMTGLKDNDSFRFNIWDFGGQEKYDATHQLFITNRSIYLFLTEARAESNYHDVFYWLNTISLFSYNSPIIVVLSKFDERKKIMPESLYKEKFKNIVQFVDVSCADGYEYTIENLKSAIKDAIQLLPQTKLTLSNHWVNIRNELEVLAQQKDYIDYKEYLKICENNKLDKERADFLSEYLNDLGVIIHHKQDLLLKKTVFINTDWCVDGMYKVLDDEIVFQNKGRFSDDDLNDIWSESRFESKQAELIRLMRDYSLCFELADRTGYIAPDLLAPDKPVDLVWDHNSNLQFEYQYTFMPAGMVSRFIVKGHSFIKDDLYWKYGVVLKYDNTEALVEEDYINSKIKISLKGENKKGLLSAIKMLIEEVHKDFDKANKLVFVEMIPCNCSECIVSVNPHFYKFNVLKKFEQKQITETNCEKSSEFVKIKSLINDVQVKSPANYFRTDDDLKIFILNLFEDVLENEISLKEGYINFWRDRNCTLPKDEVEIQPYICNAIDSYCKVRGVNLSREVSEGNGKVDILFSYTNKENQILKVCVEIKKAHHQDVETAIDTQLPVYMKSTGTESGIYLVVWFKNDVFLQPKKFNSSAELFNSISKKNPNDKNISIKIINCTKTIAPSIIKRQS